MSSYLKPYEGGKAVEPGDILMHKKWITKDKDPKPVRLEVCCPCAFGGCNLDGDLTVALLNDHHAGYHNFTTDNTPGRCFGMSFVKMKDVKFMHRGKTGGSIWDKQPEREKFTRHQRED